MDKIKTLQELQDKMDNTHQDEWSYEELSKHYKVLSMMLDNNDYHPDYRGYVDEKYYKYYLKTK
tara:strand:- start:24 stop:215 length:192 start_codon:yes stop_codon:yes gene_type:complete